MASRNIVHKFKTFLRCIGFCFFIVFIKVGPSLKKDLVNSLHLNFVSCFNKTCSTVISEEKDESQNGTHICDVNDQCNNTFGSFYCTCLQAHPTDDANYSANVAFVFCLFVVCSTVLEKSEPEITL